MISLSFEKQLNEAFARNICSFVQLILYICYILIEERDLMMRGVGLEGGEGEYRNREWKGERKEMGIGVDNKKIGKGKEMERGKEKEMVRCRRREGNGREKNKIYGKGRKRTRKKKRYEKGRGERK